MARIICLVKHFRRPARLTPFVGCLLLRWRTWSSATVARLFCRSAGAVITGRCLYSWRLRGTPPPLSASRRRLWLLRLVPIVNCSTETHRTNLCRLYGSGENPTAMRGDQGLVCFAEGFCLELKLLTFIFSVWMGACSSSGGVRQRSKRHAVK